MKIRIKFIKNEKNRDCCQKILLEQGRESQHDYEMEKSTTVKMSVARCGTRRYHQPANPVIMCSLTFYYRHRSSTGPNGKQRLPVSTNCRGRLGFRAEKGLKSVIFKIVFELSLQGKKNLSILSSLGNFILLKFFPGDWVLFADARSCSVARWMNFRSLFCFFL